MPEPTLHINLLRYGLIYTGATFALAIAPQAVGLTPVHGMTVALPPLIAAMIEGNAHAKQAGERLSGALGWRAAGIMTGVGAAIYIVIAGLTLLAAREQLAGANIPVLTAIVGAIAIFIIQYLLNRLGLRLAPGDKSTK